MPGISLTNSKRTTNHQKDPGPPINDQGEVGDESYPHRTAQGAFRKGARDMIAWVGRRLWLAGRTVIRAVKIAHHEQVRMWECILLTSGAPPLTAAGPLRWVPSLGGDRLIGSHLPAQDPTATGR
jgi:hypothetical protein